MKRPTLDHRTIGKQLGFPDCCVDTFCTLVESDCQAAAHLDRVTGVPNPLSGTGYVPCRMCRTNRTVGEMLTYIAEYRNSELPPFPQSPRIDWFSKFTVD